MAPPPPHSNHIANLYHHHHAWLQGWLLRRLGNHGSAQDLAQDTFVRLLGKEVLPRIHEPRAFLKTIARGLVANHYRAQQIEQAYLDALQNLPVEYAPSPEQSTMAIQALIELDRLLASLPAPVRQAFLLSQVDGLTQDEIAQRLNVSLATVKRHIARAVVKVSFGR